MACGISNIQKAIINSVILDSSKAMEEDKKQWEELGIKPVPQVILDEATHTYTDKGGEVYNSTTSLISGRFSEDKQVRYAPNRDAGTDIDKLFQAAIIGKGHQDIDSVITPMLPDNNLKADLFSALRGIVKDKTSDGSVPFTQVVVSDPFSKVAGSIDLLTVHPDGFGRITDLKTSVRNVYNSAGKLDKQLSDTYKSKWVQNEGSVFNDLTMKDGKIVPREQGDSPVKLSKNDQHGIQTGVYARMMELQGIPIVGTDTAHIQIDLQQNEDGTFSIKDFEYEGTLDHSMDENEPYIDQVVPTRPDENNPSVLQENRPGYDYSKEPEYSNSTEIQKIKDLSQKLYNDELDKSESARKVAGEIIKIVGQREEYIKNLNRSKQEPAIQEKTIYALGDMKRHMMRSLDAGKYSAVLNEWMNYTIRQSTITSSYLADPDNLSSDKFTSIAEQARKFIQSYAYINDMIDQVHSTQVARFNEAVGAVNSLRKSLDDATEQWNLYDWKSKDTKYLDEELENYIKGNPKDIGIFTRLFSAPSTTSSIPVSLAFSEVSAAHYKTVAAWNQFKNEAADVAKVLHKALGVKGYKSGMYEFMTHKNGNFVMREGPDHLQREADAMKNLQDDNGERLKYSFGTGPEAIVYNKELNDKIAHYSRLTQPETYNGDPGEYYEYKPLIVYDEDGKITGYDDFEEKRNEFEYRDRFGRWQMKIPVTRDIESLRWMKADGKYYKENDDGTRGNLLSDKQRTGLASMEYRNKYKYPVEKEVELEYKNGVFTGKVVPSEGKTDWHVKPQYKSMRNKRLEWDNTEKDFVETDDLRDPKYIAMMNDKSVHGIAKWKFYNDYMDNWNKLLLKLPGEQREYLKGKMPAQSSSLWRKIMDSDTPKIKLALLGDQIKGMFNSTYVGERQVDEAGNIKHSIPTGYTTSLQDQEHIAGLKKELSDIDADWNAVKNTATKQQVADYKKERGLKAAELKTEEAKLLPYQVEQDIAKSQIDTALKIEAYNQLSQIESNLLMIREMAALKAERNELAKTDANGRSLFRKALDTFGTSIKKVLTSGGSGSLELKRIDDMISMLVHHSEEYPGSFAAKLEQLPITLESLNLFLINPPVSFGVHIMMNSIHMKEGLVGQFFNYKQLAKAKFEVNAAIPAYLQNTSVKSVGGEGKKFASFPEAWIAETQAFSKGLSDDSGLGILKTEHYVEWTGVATGAIAIGLNTSITGKDGTISNTYSKDVWDQLPDGSLQIKDNYKEAWDKMKFTLNRTMADYQNRFHGAYAPIERAAVTQYPGGKSIMFLHKFIPASILSMLAPRQVHSNLGVTEGQVITLIGGINSIMKDQGDIMQRFQNGYKRMIPKGAVGNPDWDKLSDEQKKAADEKAYQDDPNYRKADGSFDQKKAERDRDTRRLELTNMRRNLVTIVYLMIATGAYMLFKSLAKDTDSDNTRRWANFLAKSMDRLRRQQLFAIPVIGLEEEYSLLKSPIASLRIMGDYAEALAATFSLPIPPYGANYYTTGVHKGELKAKVKWERVTPGINLIKWYQEQNNPSYWIR